MTELFVLRVRTLSMDPCRQTHVRIQNVRIYAAAADIQHKLCHVITNIENYIGGGHR